VLAGLRGDKTV